MSRFELSARSLQRLDGVHPHLVAVVKRAIEITPLDFVVLEGLRTAERQQQLLWAGASKTLNSRHLTGHAVDIAPFLDTDGNGTKEVSWHWPHHHQLAPYIKRAAAELSIPIEWGGDWKSFPDGPHWQLPRSTYPG